jgi:hypothetical protein
MFEAIVGVAKDSGVSNTCVVCHGGDAAARAEPGMVPRSENYLSLAAKAHSGTPDYFRRHDGPKEFYPDPASPWVNQNTCGQCHKWEVRVQWQSMMMTEAGKIQGTAWGFGGLEGYQHAWGNYAVDTFQGNDVVGTPVFRAYLESLARREPQAFVNHMSELPPAPAGGADIAADPSKAAFTHLRSEC